MAKQLIQPQIPSFISVLDGESRPDIPYYIATMISNTFRKKVLLIDNSEHAMLYNAIPDSHTGEIKKDGMLYVMAAVAYSPDFMRRFDTCICYHGTYASSLLWDKSDIHLVLTGYQPDAFERFRYEANNPIASLDLEKDFVFFLDHVTNKVNAENILKKEKLLTSDKSIPYVELPIDETDRICMLSLLYNGYQDAKATGKELYSAITGLISVITKVPLAQLKKIRR